MHGAAIKWLPNRDHDWGLHAKLIAYHAAANIQGPLRPTYVRIPTVRLVVSPGMLAVGHVYMYLDR